MCTWILSRKDARNFVHLSTTPLNGLLPYCVRWSCRRLNQMCYFGDRFMAFSSAVGGRLKLPLPIVHQRITAVVMTLNYYCFIVILHAVVYVDTANEKKNAQRTRKHCALAAVRWSQNFFAPPQTPLPGGAGRPKFNQREMIITTFNYSLVRIDARNFKLSW